MIPSERPRPATCALPAPTADAEAPYGSWPEASDFLRLVADITANIARRNAARQAIALGGACQPGGAASRSDEEPDGAAMVTACIRPAREAAR